jgi:thiamine-phosphate pyrophosphorylase
MPSPIHLVTDRRRYAWSIPELERHVGWLLDAGVDVVQVRERDLPDRALATLVAAVVARAAGSGARVLVNDRADVAIAAGAAGVHLREDSVPAPRARAIAPAGFVIGRSVHDTAGVRGATEAGGCDYLLFGTVFQSPGKPAGHPVAGTAALAEACAATPWPVLAIGGIRPDNAGAACAAGARGVAAVDYLLTAGSAADARTRVMALRRAIDTGSGVV